MARKNGFFTGGEQAVNVDRTERSHVTGRARARREQFGRGIVSRRLIAVTGD
jgi:hypothetical protein